MDFIIMNKNKNDAMKTNPNILLQVKGLRTHFFTDDGIVKAVDGVDIEVRQGEILGIVGESGCGKTVMSRSIMGLVYEPGRVVGGQILFNGRNLLEIDHREIEAIRGNQIAMIFQHPLSSLNPVFTVGDQVAEALCKHTGISHQEAMSKSLELFQQVRIPDARKRMKSFPHELSGGQAQRVMIAMALANKPQLLIADEPTTALDVTIQAQILELLKDLQRQVNMAVILITHSLGVVAEIADRIAVMYAGAIVEEADVDSIFSTPLHPYTIGLMGSIPVLGSVKKRLDVIPGKVPNLINLPNGCRFAPRCQKRYLNNLEICSERVPDMIMKNSGHKVRCWLYSEEFASLNPS